MRLYHGKYILPGLAVFLVIITFPLWFATATGKNPFQSPPNPDGQTCIDSKNFMRENHMQMLNRWRDEVVRDGQRVRDPERDGKNWLKEYPLKSLTRTCMACHGKADAHGKSTTPATYCQHCHDYVGVNTYCWDCHIDPVAAVGKEAE